MAKKSFKITYDSPFSISIAIICTLIFVIDNYFVKSNITSNFFTCADSRSFDFKNGLDYLKIITHSFGASSPFNFFVTTLLIAALGPYFEELYGSIILSIMFTVSTIVSGVCNACVIPVSLTGAESFIFTMIILSSLTSLKKKNIQTSFIFFFLLFTFFCFYSNYSTDKNFISFIGIVPQLIGGIAGSLFGLLVQPKKRSSKSETKKAEDSSSSASTVSSSDETVIGNIPL